MSEPDNPRRRVFLKDEAYATVRDYLLGEEIEDPLSERLLAARLGLGLGPLRSAVERLRAEGLIKVAPNSGLRLPAVSAKEIVDFFEMRMLVECHIAAVLAGRLTPEQSGQLDGILADQDRSAAARDIVRYHQLDIDFHTMLASFHGNGEMIRALAQLRDKMYRLSRRAYRARADRLTITSKQHRGIAEAICAGDAAQTRQRMERHLTWGRTLALDPHWQAATPLVT